MKRPPPLLRNETFNFGPRTATADSIERLISQGGHGQTVDACPSPDHSDRLLEAAFQGAGTSGTFFVDRAFISSVGKTEVQVMLLLKAIFFICVAWRNWLFMAELGMCSAPRWTDLGVCPEGSAEGAPFLCCRSKGALLQTCGAVVSNMGVALGLLLGLGAALRGHRVLSKRTILFAYYIVATMHLVSLVLAEEWPDQLFALKLCVGCLIFPSIVDIGGEKHLVAALYLNGAFDLACAAHDHFTQSVLRSQMTTYGGGLSHMVFALKITLDRHLNLRRSRKIMDVDKSKYDALWEKVLAAQGTEVQSLKRVVARMRKACFPRDARQYRRTDKVPSVKHLARLGLTKQRSLSEPDSGLAALPATPLSLTSEGSMRSSRTVSVATSRTASRESHASSRAPNNSSDFCLPALGSFNSPLHQAPSPSPPPPPEPTTPSTRLPASGKVVSILSSSFHTLASTFDDVLLRMASGGTSGSRGIDTAHPITSFSKLFEAARECHKPLLDVTKQLAWESRGMFPVKFGFVGRGIGDVAPTYVTYRDAPEGTVFRFAAVKRVQRAVEKCWRTYAGDISRLLDVCRQSIVFETVEDLELCLLLIEACPELEVVRVKNRMDPKFPSWESGGYRDVLLNLRIMNEDSVKRRVYHHTVELQLMLQGFAELRSMHGHERYISARNMKGE